MPRPPLHLLGLAALLAGCVLANAQTSTVTSGPGGVSAETSVRKGPNGKPCKVVESGPSDGSGTLSSTVTAGPGGVRSSSTGGPSVTVRSGDGTSSSTAASSGDGTTATTTGDGDCVVTVPKGSK
jgi:hypothetical protein